MRLPTSVLSRVRGSVALVALASCSSPAPAVTSISPERAPVVESAMAPDPVAYDSTREAERLARLDDGQMLAATERSARIDESVAMATDARNRRTMEAIREAIGGTPEGVDPIWSSGGVSTPGIGISSRMAAGCGRG